MHHHPLYIVWQERNETGIPLIDEQHRGVVSIINSFHYMMSENMGNTMMYSCISDTLKNYSHIHFVTEEALLKEFNYPGLEKHIEAHKGLAIEVERIGSQAIRDQNARPLLEFLKKWWIEHINEEDQLYVPYLRSSGKPGFGR